jgi:hypothetical protein
VKSEVVYSLSRSPALTLSRDPDVVGVPALRNPAMWSACRCPSQCLGLANVFSNQLHSFSI